MSEAVLTRNESYQRIQGHLGNRQRKLYRLLKEATDNGFTMTDRQMSKAMHWSINCVTPRRGELENLGLVVCAGVAWDCETRRKATMWKVKE